MAAMLPQQIEKAMAFKKKMHKLKILAKHWHAAATRPRLETE